MKIFYLDPQSYNNLSVYDKSLLENIEAGDASSASCSVVYYHNVKYQCERLPGILYKSIYNYSDKKHVFKLSSYVVSTLHVCVDCLRHRPDVVHIQWFRWWYIDCVLLLLLRLLHIKVMHTAHNVLPHNPKSSDRKHYQWFYRHVDAIVVHTHRTKEELVNDLSVDGSKVHVIAHGMLPSTVEEDRVVARMQELSQLLDLDGKVIFASMGFQNYYKGIDLISDAWKLNPQLHANPQCMLMIVGNIENAQLEELKQYANVHVVDELVSDVDFDAYLRLSSVALLPYRKISQSGVLLTALQRHVPVLVSDVGGLTDPFCYARVGWSIGQPTVENLANALLQLVGDPLEVAKVRDDQAAFQVVEDAYSWSRIGEKTAQLYKDILR